MGFIYVFCDEAKERLLGLGYKLLKSDAITGTHIFVNNGRKDFENADISYILSDTLTF